MAWRQAKHSPRRDASDPLPEATSTFLGPPKWMEIFHAIEAARNGSAFFNIRFSWFYALRTGCSENCFRKKLHIVGRPVCTRDHSWPASYGSKQNHSKSHWTLESDPPLVIWRLGSCVPLRSRHLTSMKIWCCRLPLLAASRICCADVNRGGYSLETTAKIMKLGHSLSPPLPLSS